jgi:CheY-like chemotaxis protein
VEENFRPRLEEKRIELRMDVEPDLPASHWDYQKMMQVFQNLVDNALKFTPAGGWIGITARLRGDFIEVLVADNGIGIPKEKVGQVFDRFYQVDSSATRRYGGVGLGLSIVREIVLAHNGKIFVESEEGKGTTFQVLMPHGVPARETTEQTPTLARSPSMARGKGEKVLLVDDDPSFLEMMRTVLPTEGFHVISTTVSREAMELARAEGVRAVLLDLMMADMDGFEVCRRLRNDPATSHLPIVILSAAGGSDVVKRVTAAGADDYLIKPFDNEEVVSRLAELIRHGRGAGKLNHPPQEDGGGKKAG